MSDDELTATQHDFITNNLAWLVDMARRGFEAEGRGVIMLQWDCSTGGKYDAGYYSDQKYGWRGWPSDEVTDLIGTYDPPAEMVICFIDTGPSEMVTNYRLNILAAARNWG